MLEARLHACILCLITGFRAHAIGPFSMLIKGRTLVSSGNNSLALHGRRIRCILFDCGETLWTYLDYARGKYLTGVANQHAITLLRQLITQQNFPLGDDENLGHKLRKAIDVLMHQERLNHPYDEPDFPQVTLEALIQLGFPQLRNEVGETIFEALRVRSSEAHTLFPDALTTLATLQQRGFVLGIVTNRAWGGQTFVEDMHAFGLLDYFDPACMAVSVNLGIRKPNPAIFMYALDALHCLPEESAMVGDSLSADVTGANQSNVFSIWKPAPRLIAEVKADLPPDSPYPNDKYLLSYLQRQSEQQNRPLSTFAKPDLTIERLSDLLNVFLEVGAQ